VINKGKTNAKLTPVGKPLLNKDLDGVPQKYDWEYWAAIRILRSVCPDIAMAVHQCARFSVFPMHLHEQTVMRIGWYFSSTCKKAMPYKPDSLKGLKYMLMLTMQASGIQLTLVMLTTSIQELDLSFDMLAVPYFGKASSKLRLHFQRLELSILRYLKL
jgi:hypothetical protein